MVICPALISALLTLPLQHFELKTDKEDFFTNWKLYGNKNPLFPLPSATTGLQMNLKSIKKSFCWELQKPGLQLLMRLSGLNIMGNFACCTDLLKPEILWV